MAPNVQTDTDLQLPLGVVTKVDVGRLLRELEALNEFLKQSAIRQPGTPIKFPKTSRLMEEIATNNKLNMIHDDERKRLTAFLKQTRDHAPVLHMSFSADPSPQFTQKLITWLRAEIHPTVVLQIGLQPNIGAGCVVRTSNKYFDFSLRSRFKENKDVLAKMIAGAVVQ